VHRRLHKNESDVASEKYVYCYILVGNTDFSLAVIESRDGLYKLILPDLYFQQAMLLVENQKP